MRVRVRHRFCMHFQSQKSRFRCSLIQRHAIFEILRMPDAPEGLKNIMKKQCINWQRFLIILGAFWEPPESHLGAIWSLAGSAKRSHYGKANTIPRPHLGLSLNM